MVILENSYETLDMLLPIDVNPSVIMAHPLVVDDERGASPLFLRCLWLTMNNQNSERHAICCDRQQVFPMTVERCGTGHVTLDDVFVAQFGSASSTRRVIELAVEDILGQATIFHTVDVA